MPLQNLLIVFFTAIVSLACYHRVERNRHAATIADAMSLIERHYVEPVESETVFENAMRGMVDKLDSYSAYYSPESFQQMEESLDQEFGGVGIVVEVDTKESRLTVQHPLVGTPAYKAGIRSGDVILEIDGHDTEGMDLRDSVKLMRGPPGSVVHLLVRRQGEAGPLTFDLERAIIPVDSVLGDTRNADSLWNFFLEDQPRIAYLRLTQFGKQTTTELTRAMQFGERPVDGMIIDLRNNAGGLLSGAVEVCDMFLEPGLPVVSTRGRNGREIRSYKSRNGATVDPKLPVVVLINRYSASASEIVAACLQDHDRATIVGERSWGKGTVQNIFELEGGHSALKLTTASYWRPSGQNIHRLQKATDADEWGVKPNPGFEVILTDQQFEAVLKQRRERDTLRTDSTRKPSTAEPFVDPQIQKAVEFLRSKSARGS